MTGQGETAVPTAAMLVIGDEILSGRTQDANAHHLAGRMGALGIPLVEIRVVRDVHEEIVAAVQDLSPRVSYLFTSGGIGPTHDDITADAVAAAFGAAIDVREDARALLAAFYAAKGDVLNEARLRMARIPDGARLIDNPVSVAPGFVLQNVHVMAGVPSVFRAMLEGLEPGLEGGPPILSHGFEVMLPEGELAAPLGKLADAHRVVSVGCYPLFRDRPGARVVLRSANGAALDRAVTDIREVFHRLAGDAFVEEPPAD